MKTRLYSFLMLILLIAFSHSTSYAQRVELTAFGGYQYWGAYKYYNGATNGKLALDAGPCYGGMLGFELAENSFVELVYNHQDSKLVDRPNYGVDRTITSVGVNYFMINGVRTITVNDQVEPYATLGIGAALFDPVSSQSGQYQLHSLWKFAVDFGAGVKYYVSDKVGIRMGIGFWAPIQGVGLGVGVGTGGAYAGASTYTTVIQMNATAGLIFRLQN